MDRTKPEVQVDKDSKIPIEVLKKSANGFTTFLNKHSIIALSIGVVIGQTTKETVNVIVTGLITPTIQLLIPNTRLQELVITVGKAQFQIGAVIDAIIQLIVIMLLLYLVFGVILKREDLLDSKKKSK